MMTPPVSLLLLFTAVLTGSLLGTGVIRRLAYTHGWLVESRADRWHKHPTALHGGVGFYPALFGGVVYVLVQAISIHQAEWKSFSTVPQEFFLAIAILLGSLVMGCIGLWDDLKEMSPATKLLYQLLATSLFVYSGGVFYITGLQVLDIVVTYFWFVGIINAVNMLDNMDGLASGTVIVAGTALICLVLYANGTTSKTVLALPLAIVFVATLLGFWCHNRPPALIFMGDSGSLSTGYVMAALAMPSPLNGAVTCAL